jgi:hypothetical protein
MKIKFKLIADIYVSEVTDYLHGGGRMDTPSSVLLSAPQHLKLFICWLHVVRDVL